MSRVRIEGPSRDGPDWTSCGTRLFLDGQELTDLRAIDLRVRVDEVVQVTAEVFAGPDLSCELGADVTVNIIPPDVEGWTIEESTLPDGGKRYRVVREAKS